MEGSCGVSCCAWFGLAVFGYAGPRVGVDAGVVKVLLEETLTAAYWLEALITLCHTILQIDEGRSRLLPAGVVVIMSLPLLCAMKCACVFLGETVYQACLQELLV